MNKDDAIHSFLSDVEEGITPSIETLTAIAKILKSKKKPGRKPYEEKSFSEIGRDIDIVNHFISRTNTIGRDEALAETAGKIKVSERTIERKKKEVELVQNDLKLLYSLYVDNKEDIQNQIKSFEPKTNKERKIHFILEQIFKEL